MPDICRRLRELETENNKLKRLLADILLEVEGVVPPGKVSKVNSTNVCEIFRQWPNEG